MSNGSIDEALRRGTLSRRELGRLAAGLAAGTSLGGLALPGGARAQTPTKGGNLSVAISGGASTDTLDPIKATASFHAFSNFTWGNPLIELDEKLQPVPELATSWDSKDGITWNFKIRQGVTFHNGKTMDVDDVVASLQLHVGEKSESGAAGYFSSVKEIKADGKDGFTVVLSEPNADFPYVLSDYHVIIMPKDADRSKGIGTGAYAVDSFEPGVRAFFKRNPTYFKADRAHVDSVELLAIADAAARTSALQTGQVLVMERADPKTAGLLAKAPGIKVVQAKGGGHYLFLARCDTAPFDNADLRLALKYAIDRKEIVDKVLRGYGTVGNDQPIPSGDPMWADLPQRPYDPDKAKFHFGKSGASGKIALSTSNAAFTGAEDAAVLYQEQARKAGIEIEVIREPADGYWDNVWMKKPFSASYWGGRPVADMMLTVAYKSDAAWNDTFWRRPDFDKLLLAARAELDPAKRKPMYFELQKMIHDDGGAIIPMFNDFVDAHHESVMGFGATPQYGLDGVRIAERTWIAA